jgi:hypothetical protein
MLLDLPFLVQDIDPFGNVRRYVRKKVEGRYRKERLRSQPAPNIPCRVSGRP